MPVEVPTDVRVAWLWDDGWTLRRATTVSAAERMRAEFYEVERDSVDFAAGRVDSVDGSREWLERDHDGHLVPLYVYSVDGQMRCSVLMLTSWRVGKDLVRVRMDCDRGSPGWFYDVVHVVSLAWGLRTMRPECRIGPAFVDQFGRYVDSRFYSGKFSSDPREREVRVQCSHAKRRSWTNDEDPTAEEVLFSGFEPYLVPGRCPDMDCQVNVLLGNLPHLFWMPTHVLEQQHGG